MVVPAAKPPPPPAPAALLVPKIIVPVLTVGTCSIPAPAVIEAVTLLPAFKNGVVALIPFMMFAGL